MNKPLEEVDLNENPAAAAFQQIKFEEETPEGTTLSIGVLTIIFMETKWHGIDSRTITCLGNHLL